MEKQNNYLYDAGIAIRKEKNKPILKGEQSYEDEQQ
jgi:hypothetical protein